MRIIQANVGFITNSSSCVYGFPAALLEVREVKQFMDAYLSGSYINGSMWDRSTSDAIALDRDTKQRVHADLYAEDAYSPSMTFDPNNDAEIIVVYGDEYTSLASTFAELLCETARKLSLPYRSDDFN